MATRQLKLSLLSRWGKGCKPLSTPTQKHLTFLKFESGILRYGPSGILDQQSIVVVFLRVDLKQNRKQGAVWRNNIARSHFAHVKVQQANNQGHFGSHGHQFQLLAKSTFPRPFPEPDSGSEQKGKPIALFPQINPLLLFSPQLLAILNSFSIGECTVTKAVSLICQENRVSHTRRKQLCSSFFPYSLTHPKKGTCQLFSEIANMSTKGELFSRQ